MTAPTELLLQLLSRNIEAQLTALSPLAVQLQQQLFALQLFAVTAAGYSNFGHLCSTEESELSSEEDPAITCDNYGP